MTAPACPTCGRPCHWAGITGITGGTGRTRDVWRCASDHEHIT